MTPTDWNRIRALFDEALQQPEAERAAFLDRACADGPELRPEVESLLAAHARAQEAQAFESPFALPTGGDGGGEGAADESGSRVGPYRLVRRLGRGGMGTVYLAERADGQFQQTVALKLIRRGLDTDDVLARFAFERQILAGLDHPNIARLYDGGVAADGRPYFAMEAVEGEPITDYCDRHRLSTTQRLELFRTVCGAVRHAHRNLVIHRDLKPSNILVADGQAEDGTPGTPQVKLLDFGIAKLLAGEEVGTGMDGAALAMPRTRTGRRVLTPEYAAPEQVQGAAVTTATDVYQLGVLLYELLTGRRPYRLSSRVQAEIERAILEDDPERPSTAVAHPGDRTGEDRGDGSPAAPLTPDTVSRARSTDLGRLQRQLAGDLDVICLKALKKEPDRRYAGVDALAEDVERHLDGRPVAARPDTFAYRASRFVRRHRVGVGAAVLVLLAVLAGAGVAFWQAGVAAAERDRARVESEKTARVNAFLQEVLSAADPYEDAQAATVLDALDAASRRVGTDLAGQPEIEAEVRRTVGIAYQNLSRYDDAEPHLQAALALRRDVHGPAHADVAESLKDVALLRNYQGRNAESDSLYRRALALHRSLAAGPTRGLAEALNDYGALLLELEAYADAEPYLRDALAAYRTLLGEEHVDVATALNNLAMAEDGLGNVAAADSLYRMSLQMQRRLLGDEHPMIAKSLNNYAFVLFAQGDLEGTEDYFRQSLEVRRKLLGEEHPDVALAHHNVGSILYLQERYDEAVPHSRAAAGVLQRSVPEHPALANYLTRLGDIHAARRDWPASNAAYREALSVPGLSLTQQAGIAARLGDGLQEEGRTREAVALLRPLHAALQAAAPPDTAGLALVHQRLAALDPRH